MGDYRKMKLLFLTIDTITLAITYIAIFVVVFSDKVDAYNTFVFVMLGILFADRTKREIERDLKL